MRITMGRGSQSRVIGTFMLGVILERWRWHMQVEMSRV